MTAKRLRLAGFAAVAVGGMLALALVAGAAAMAVVAGQSPVLHGATSGPQVRGPAARPELLTRWRQFGVWAHTAVVIPVHARPTTASPVVTNRAAIIRATRPQSRANCQDRYCQYI